MVLFLPLSFTATCTFILKNCILTLQKRRSLLFEFSILRELLVETKRQRQGCLLSFRGTNYEIYMCNTSKLFSRED